MDQWEKNITSPLSVQYLFNNEMLSDIKFLFNSDVLENKHLSAHSLILCGRSEIFYHKFKDSIGTMKIISVDGYSYEIYHEFIKFLYYDECELNLDNVFSILGLAREFKIFFLAEKCTSFLKKHMSLNNVCIILNKSISNDFELIKIKCLDMICKNYSEVLLEKSFMDLNKQSIKEILKLDCVNYANEIEVINAVIKWIDNSKVRDKIPDEKFDRRIYIGDLIYLIRFPLLSPDEFREFLSKYPTLLSDSEISLCVASNFIKSSTIFSTAIRRKNNVIITKEIIRKDSSIQFGYGNLEKLPNNIPRSTNITISFAVSKKITISSFDLIDNFFNYADSSIEIFNDKCAGLVKLWEYHFINKNLIHKFSNGNKTKFVHHIKLEEPLSLNPDAIYKISINYDIKYKINISSDNIIFYNPVMAPPFTIQQSEIVFKFFNWDPLGAGLSAIYYRE